MIARSVSITGIAALVVIGTAMLLVTTPAPPDSAHLPHPVAFWVETQSYDGHIIFSGISRHMILLFRKMDAAHTAWSPCSPRTQTTLASIDQVRHEISGLEPLHLMAPCNPGDTCSPAMVIRSPDAGDSTMNYRDPAGW